MPDRPPTLRDIAARLGLSNAAVSMALRNHPGVSAETSRRVRAQAEAMGWKPNPLLSAYQTQVRSGKPLQYQATIAWLDDLHQRAGGLQPVRRLMREAAVEHAARSGYKVEEISLEGLLADKISKNVERFRRVMDSRGITGFILPIGWRAHHAVLDWKPFAVAIIGRTERALETSPHAVSNPMRYHSVAGDALGNTHLAIRQLRAAGRRRIGMALSDYHHINTDHLHLAGLLLEQNGMKPAERVPFLPLPALGAEPPSVFLEWLDKHRPDAVLCHNAEMVDWIKRSGRKVPDDVAVAHLNLGPMEQGWSGIDEHLAAQAAAAVDLIVGQLGRNEREAPASPKQVLIRGHWRVGRTV